MRWRSLRVSAALALGLAVAASAESPHFDLCIEQSPAKAGIVTPDSGTHRFAANSVVTLSAEPQTGYRFAYWLGDVADPASKNTTVHVDSPKVIVAIFKPVEDDLLENTLGGGGGTSLVPTFVAFGSSGFSSCSGSRTETHSTTPIHTPEPTTLGLLALGALALRRIHGSRKCRTLSRGCA